MLFCLPPPFPSPPRLVRTIIQLFGCLTISICLFCHPILPIPRFASCFDVEHRLEFIKEIGNTHIQILDGLDSLIQLTALVARLCRLGTKDKFDQ